MSNAKPTFSPIAVIGMACRLPGAKNIDEFWSMLREGRSALGKVPESRFNRELFYDPTPGVLNKTYTDLAGLVEYHPYPKDRYPLPEFGETDYDAAHLAFCESVGDSLVHAGFDPFHVNCPNTGVFVGHTRPGDLSQQFDYQICLPESLAHLESLTSYQSALQGKNAAEVHKKLEAAATSSLKQRDEKRWTFYLSSDLALLVSRAYQFNGPGIVFNSACASSLHAICQAVYSLQLGHIDMAVAGGATYFHSDTLVLFASSRSLTKNRSCPFDAEADGLIMGEGNVALILKRLEDAVADGNTIHAVISGTGIASDGKGKSLWAPRKEGQIEAMNRAYSGTVRLDDVDFVEAHATSTALGDATEMEALATVFQQVPWDRKIPVHSTKGNIGHMLEVAGAASVLKTILAITHQTIPPIAGLKTLNPKIAWNEIPFFAPTKLMSWEAPANGRPRRAAVNSFGIGGLNVHLVLDEWNPQHSSAKHFFISSSETVNATSTQNNFAKNETAPPPVPLPIAVIGYGCIFPQALTSTMYWDLLINGKNGFGNVPDKRWMLETFRKHEFAERSDVPPFRAGVIDNYSYDWKKNKVPPKQVENASPIQFMMLDAVNEALTISGMSQTPEERRRMGVVVGTGFGGDFACQMNVVLTLPIFLKHLRNILRKEAVAETVIDQIASDYSQFLHKRMPALLDETGSFTPSALASRITKTLDLMGGAVAMESQEASVGAALACCIDQLAVGMNDTMICVSGYQELDPVVYNFCAKSQLLTEHPERSPLDKNAYGRLPGEGCGVLILQRLDKAVQEKRPVYAVIRGTECATADSVYNNTKLAIERTRRYPTQQTRSVDFLEASFCGIPAIDAQYLDAYIDATKNDIAEDNTVKNNGSYKTKLGTTLNQTGFLAMASGIPSLVKYVMALHQKITPPIANHQTTAPFVARYQQSLEAATHPVQWTPADSNNPHRAGLLCGEKSVYYVLLEEKNF
ncbi:MAG: hypothetical protein LBJ67_04620 [Planctomycetaceae bacterium]|jgi:acyl transferase domain-containing protein|nr:hypothetical protein [Planctomycetaceae bacterium]